jgi:predicted esterase YcpF (UPF0227 family)
MNRYPDNRQAQKNRYADRRSGLGGFFTTRALNLIMFYRTIVINPEINIAARLKSLINRTLTNPHNVGELLLSAPVHEFYDVDIAHLLAQLDICSYKYYLFF